MGRYVKAIKSAFRASLKSGLEAHDGDFHRYLQPPILESNHGYRTPKKGRFKQERAAGTTLLSMCPIEGAIRVLIV